MATADLPPVSHLPVEAKRRLLALLAHDLFATAEGEATVLDAGGGVMIYHVPADARKRAEQAMREATPEELAELERRAADTDPANWITAEELIRQLREEDGPLPGSPTPSGPGGG